jgi:hypothetical protein
MESFKGLVELSIFRQSFKENILLKAKKCIFLPIPSLSFEVETEHSANEQSYSANAWKQFYRNYFLK